MRDYLIIVTKNVKGFYSLDDERVDEVTFKFIRYYFPNREVAERWMPALISVLGKKNFGKFWDVDPKLPQSVLKRVGVINPKFEVTFEHADDPANLTHRVVDPPVKIPGFKIKFYEITLKSPGLPDITSGQVGMDIDAKGAPIQTEKPTTKPIKPPPPKAEEDAMVPPGPEALEPVDRIENGLENPKVSGLDRFLKKVKVDVRVTDDGLAATIDVDPEGASIARIAFEKATLEAAYTSKGFSASGEVKLSYAPDPKKLSGSVKASYKKGAWMFEGKATVAGLIDGLDAFDVKIVHDGQAGTTTIGTPKVHVHRKFKGIALNGDIVQLSYNVTDGGLSADNVKLAADLGPFGSASASAKIDDNKITRATFAYDSPELAFPRKNPVLRGKLGGEVTYEHEQLSGKINGTAHLHVPALDKIAKGLSDLGLTVAAKINADGSYEGTIASDQSVKLGKHFEIPQITATLAPDGSISSDFTISIVDLSILKKGEIHCTLGPNGFAIKSIEADGRFGEPQKGKYWGEVGLKYQTAEQAFVVSGSLNYKIKEGMVATGTITYNSATHKVDTDLAISRITLLQLHKQNKLLDLEKQIVVFSFYSIVGAYLDLGFTLVFDLDFDIGVEPKFQLKELDLVTFKFKEIDGQVKLDGKMRAALTATPHIGLGIYAISPSVLRAGGGLEFPIVAEAKLNPNAIIHVQYTPEGGVKGAAKAALTLTFGITGAVRPYAEFAVMDDLYNASWHGDELTSFTILPERELFTHVIDFGDKLEKEENPKLPTTAKAPPPPRSDTQVVPQEKGQAKPTAVDTTKKDAPKEEKGEEPKDEQGFSLTNLIAGLKRGESYQKIEGLLNSIAKVWGALKKVWQWVVKFFRNWYDRIKQFLDDLAEFFRRLGDEGLLAAIKWVLLKVLGPDLYEIIVPILDALQAAEEKFYKLLETPLPDGFTGFITWTIDVVRGIIGIGFDTIVDLGKAVVEVARRAAKAAVRFLNGLIKHGKIGVKRTPRYVGSETLGLAHYFLSADHYKIQIGSIDVDSDHSDDSIRWPSPSAAVAYGLWYALDAIPGVYPTNTRVDPDSGDPYDDYWY